MKWFLAVSLFLGCAKLSVSSAIRCKPGDKDESCITKSSEKVSKSNLLSGKECSPGTQWTSRCNQCECTAEGYVNCSLNDCPGQENEPLLRCAPDTVWKNDCNTCWCTAYGQAMCTRMGCLGFNITDWNPTPTKNTDSHIVPTNETDTYIVPINETETNTINPVNILDARELEVFLRPKRSSSQQKSNPAETTPSRLAPIVKETPKSCQPGLEFRMDCNKCLCDNEGQNFSCTRIDCAALNSNGNGGDRTKREVTSQNQTDCTPGSVFEQGCNVCRCTEDGNHATCTMKICNKESSDNDINAPESDPSFRCNPGEQFKRGCNDCTCSADGKSVFCTLRLCDQEINPS